MNQSTGNQSTGNQSTRNQSNVRSGRMQLDDVVSELQIPFLPENGRRTTAARTAQASSPRTELTGQKYVIVKSKNIKRDRVPQPPLCSRLGSSWHVAALRARVRENLFELSPRVSRILHAGRVAHVEEEA